MNKLPLELHDYIVEFVRRRIVEGFVPSEGHRTLPVALSAIAAVSRNFQQAVERLTFRELRVTTSPSDLDNFRRALTPRRQRNLQRLIVHLRIYHPLSRTAYPYPPWSFATGEERRVINETTTTQLRELFNILTAWRLPEPSLTLEVADTVMAYRTEHASPTYLRFSMLDVLGDLVDFPPLPMVKQLYVYSMTYHLHPHLVVSLTAKMPNVSHVDWDLSICDTIGWGLYHYMSRIWRDGLVQSIESTGTLPRSVEKFSFKMFRPINDKIQILPNFIGSTASPDSVSSALRKLTKDCAEVYIEGSIHASLFDPLAVLGTAPHEAALTWEKVTRLEVRASMRGPDGKWLFKIDPNGETPANPPEYLDFDRLPPGYGTTDLELDEADEYYHKYREDMPDTVDADDPRGEFVRTEVDDGPMNQLLATFARGCRRGNAPALRTAILRCESSYKTGNWPFQVNCFAASAAAPPEWHAQFAGGDRDAWHVFFQVGKWRPAEETLEEFRRIRRERDGHDTVLRFLPWIALISINQVG